MPFDFGSVLCISEMEFETMVACGRLTYLNNLHKAKDIVIKVHDALRRSQYDKGGKRNH